ncbi:hypothetical protein LJY25_10755 [Hymenobacter sp. BT175]|uniref:hypothetical protein n=1 Tax=Hymenobacter translucens TaxID=2886507 RepID=UPI001D0E4C85|nr:hypothetical protein [Hymenobacter translucens]MCC2546925.1 hypothetical protein [Hymenobacter translucens]
MTDPLPRQLPQPVTLNFYQRLVRQLIAAAFNHVLIPALWWLYGPQDTQALGDYLPRLPIGTLGRGVADLLVRHELQLIPHYQDHDLKHVLLGYDMTSEDELRLKAFMLGNGDWSLACLGLLAFALLTPELWPGLYLHYRRGRRTQSVVHWRLADYAAESVEALRYQIGFYEAQEN